ncbi:MAG: chemotaxis protein CheW [Candidatus Heimdallarchaeota archaeon]
MALDVRKNITRFDATDEVRYVVFRLGTEKFGVRIEQIKEVLLIDDVTAVPRAQEYVLGVINLRGVVCTVIDLPRRLNVRRVETKTEAEAKAESETEAKTETEAETEAERLSSSKTISTMIVEIGKNTIGMAVDQVESITPISMDQIETQLDMVKKEIHTPFLAGVAKMEHGNLIILLDLDVIFSEYEIGQLTDLADGKTEERGNLADELDLSQDEMQRLDLAYDDIDELALKTNAKESQVRESADSAPIKPKTPKTKLSEPIILPEAEGAAPEKILPIEAPESLEDEKTAPKKVEPTTAATALEKPEKPATKTKGTAPKTDSPEPALPVSPPAIEKPPSKKKKALKTDALPPLSKKELTKLTKNDLVKMAVDMNIPNPKRKKKADLVKLLLEIIIKK